MAQPKLLISLVNGGGQIIDQEEIEYDDMNQARAEFAQLRSYLDEAEEDDDEDGEEEETEDDVEIPEGELEHAD